MKHLTRKAVKGELWNMLSDDAKKSMKPLKKSYLASLMADIDSYTEGVVKKKLKKLKKKK